jgi:CheY-like chemotaxis protein
MKMSRTVLVVEDCPDTRGFMTYLAQSFGYQVLEASDALEAYPRQLKVCNLYVYF